MTDVASLLEVCRERRWSAAVRWIAPHATEQFSAYVCAPGGFGRFYHGWGDTPYEALLEAMTAASVRRQDELNE